MKTNQVMKRQMGVFSIYQRTGDGFFSASALLKQWNNTLGNPRRDMKKFLDSPNTKEFIDALKQDLNKSTIGEKIDNKVFTINKERNKSIGRSSDNYWMHPYLFIKFAMWINPKFELDVIKFVSDQMLQYRNEAGEAYKLLAKSISSLVGDNNLPKYLPNIAKAINHVVFGEHSTMIRNEYGSEDKQRDLWALERKLAELVEDGFITTYDQLMAYLRKKWIEKYQPKVLK